MKTTTFRTAGAIFSAAILMTSCVSSKKYHRSQDEVAKLRTDSTTLAQKASTLQQNLTATEQKAADLQKNVEAATTTNTGLQKNVAYYSEYATKDQAETKQIKDELNTALAANGLTEQDIVLTDGKIYVNIGEKNLFKGSSAVLTSKGKELVSNLGQFVKSHDAVDVAVADLEQSSATGENMDASGSSASGTATNGNMTSGTNSSSSASTANGSATNNNADYSAKNTNAADKTAHKTAMVHHKKKVTATSGESKSVAYSSGNKSNKYTSERTRRSTARAIAWKRQNAVADALLKTGIPKVKVVAQDQPATATSGAQKGVQVVLVHGADNFYKHMSEAPAAGAPVSKLP